MSAVGITCGLNIIATFACLAVLYGEFDYLETMSKIMIFILASVNILSFLVNMGWVL